MSDSSPNAALIDGAQRWPWLSPRPGTAPVAGDGFSLRPFVGWGSFQRIELAEVFPHPSRSPLVAGRDCAARFLRETFFNLTRAACDLAVNVARGLLVSRLIVNLLPNLSLSGL
jgi:hypothetical protein